VAIIESSDNAIYSKTIDGALITSWNEGAERLFGYKAAEMIGQSGVSIIPQAFLAEENEFRGRVGKGEHIRSHETVRIAKGGRPIAVSMTVSPIRDSAGRIIEESAIVSDITERRRAEESRSRLAAIIESSDDAIISKKLDGTITSWNAGAEKLFGYQVAEMIGQPITRIIPPELQADEKEILDRLKNGGRIRSYETVRIAKDGRRVNTSLTISPIFDGEGKIIGASKICRDISERKRDEVALRESEKRFSEMFNSSPVATSLSTVREGRYLDVNDAWAKMYERPRDDVVGRTVFDLNIWVDLDRRAALFAKLQERGIVRDFEMELRSKSGRVVQISWSGTKVVIGGESCLLGSALDITERKLAEEMLRASEAKFRTLVENIPQKILMKDRNCRWISISKNLARDFGFRPEDVVGKTDSQLFTPELAAKYHADDVRIMETGHVEELEEKYLAEGKETWVNTIKTPVRNANGEIVGVLGIFWDITERKQAQEALRTLNAELEQRVRDRTTALEASNKELEAFSYSVSHDLRAPLRAMDGFSMALLDDNAGKLDETAQGYLRRIRAGSQRMATLIDDLLNLSRVTRAKLLRESVDLTAMAEEIGGEFQKSQPERQVALIVAPGLAVYADRSTLRVVLNNLLGNAWKFTGRCAQARIEVGAQERDGQRIFFVRDNGAGFDMAYVDKLFGAFQRLHSTQEFEGTGIGLALVQRIINRHGGRAWAEGAVGRGATVYFTLEEKGTDS
jgi:PAS domain S-box-containing protein